MAVRDILELGDPHLRLVSESITAANLREVNELVTDLLDTREHWAHTINYRGGIAAPQYGVLKRVVAYPRDNKMRALINPTITERSEDTMIVWEHCLNSHQICCQVSRHRWISVSYYDLSGEPQEELFQSEDSALLQQAIEHLDGVLWIDQAVDPGTLCMLKAFRKHHAREHAYVL